MSSSKKWALFRFSVIGNLLASPPKQGELREKIAILANQVWIHPTTKENFRIGFSTIEKWYYRVKDEKQSPVDVLIKKKRGDFNISKVMTFKIKQALEKQTKLHPGWSKKLHSDNLNIIVANNKLEKAPSYSTVKVYLSKIGYIKQSSRNSRKLGYKNSMLIKNNFEQRSYEHEHVGAMFHLDFHNCSREIITSSGEIVVPRLLGIIDDASRLIAHLQWYLSETAENLVHGFMQAIQKRGLPRKLMSDNGSAMLSKEFTNGLINLGIIHECTLPYSPEQNGKCEIIWAQIEGRLMAMIENKEVITLKELNEMTQAWVEMEYNKNIHSGLQTTPLDAFLSKGNVLRKSPETSILKNAFRRIEKRKVRRSDATISLEGKRFEIPDRFRHFINIHVAYSNWDLSNVHIIDESTDKICAAIFPQNKQKNANGKRKQRIDYSSSITNKKEELKFEMENEVAPIMGELLKCYQETGLPFSYKPKEE